MKKYLVQSIGGLCFYREFSKFYAKKRKNEKKVKSYTVMNIGGEEKVQNEIEKKLKKIRKREK